jgi:hypothetical protein
MISQLLVRELRTAVARNKHEVMSDGGIWLPGAKSEIRVGGVFEHKLNDEPWRVDANLLPTEGLNAMLDIALGALAKQANWYMAPFATATTPINTLTAATFDSAMTEFTNYTEVSRSLWTPAAAAAGVVTNAATPIQITIGSATGTVNTSIHGLGLISASAKEATGGKLMACTLFKDSGGDPRPRLGLVQGDLLGLRYTITLTST